MAALRITRWACWLGLVLPTWGQADPAPAWLQWHGWSDDGQRLAIRTGSARALPQRGQPVDILKVDPKGEVVDTLRVTDDVLPALIKRHIRVQPGVERQQVTPVDVLLRTKSGQLLAVVVRGSRAAVLFKTAAGSYEVVHRWQVREPATALTVFGWEDPTGRLLAVGATSAPAATAHLAVVPLAMANTTAVEEGDGDGSRRGR